MIPVPSPPDFHVDWDALDARFDWVRAMKGVVQDPVHHAEGDVWIHTKMVCEAMAALPAFRALSETHRRIAFAGALLHDVGKPTRTQVGDDGRVTSKGHSTHGAMLARRILWQLGVAFAEREQIVALVRHHQEPFWLIEREDPLRLVAASSQRVACELLAILSEADARGRTCADQAKILDAIALYRAYAEEQGCLSTPYAFPSAHARFLYLGGRQSQATHAPHEQFRCEVTLMSGFPGAGKDRWVAENAKGLPVVSLDALRATLDVDPEDEQGSVVQAAREEAREHLRAGRSFVWNATNLSRRLRGQCIRLFADYDAKIRIVYVEVPEPVLHAQNKARPNPVPARVLEALLDRWEVPDPGESHEIVYEVKAQ